MTSERRQTSGELRKLIEQETEAAEAAQGQEWDGPVPDHVTVSRPGRSRSKVLQVRLNPEEFEALEAIAARRDLPVSTVAREQLLVLVDREQATSAGNITEWTVKLALNQLADLAISIRDAADSDAPQLTLDRLVGPSPLIRPGADTALDG